MKVALTLAIWVAAALPCLAADILFTGRIATFTNLQGTLYQKVTLVKGDTDGLIWRSGVSGGRICYTNLHPDLLESWGIETNRIGVALARAQRKAVADARYRAFAAAQAQARLRAEKDEKVRLAAQAEEIEREVQRQSELAQIKRLREQVDIARSSLRHAETAAKDANAANSNNPAAPYYYVRDSVRVELEDAEGMLQKLEGQYTAKYGKIPSI